MQAHFVDDGNDYFQQTISHFEFRFRDLGIPFVRKPFSKSTFFIVSYRRHFTIAFESKKNSVTFNFECVCPHYHSSHMYMSVISYCFAYDPRTVFLTDFSFTFSHAFSYVCVIVPLSMVYFQLFSGSCKNTIFSFLVRTCIRSTINTAPCIV